MNQLWHPETITVELIDKDNPRRAVSILQTIENPNIHWVVVIWADGNAVWAKTKLEKIQSSDDYSQVYTRLEAWLPNERISTIIHSSTSLLLSVTETFTHWWTAPNYYLISSVLS